MKTHRITGELKVRGVGGREGGPFHLGAPEERPAYVDRVVFRDGLGQLVLPGTSLAGVLAGLARASLRAAGWANPEQAAPFIALFGSARGVGTGTGQESRLKVFDSRLADAATLVRDRNAINRERGSADDKRLFREEVVDGTWSFPICLELTETGPRTPEEQGSDQDPDALARLLLFDALSIMEAGWATIGGSSAIGYGWIRLEGCCVATWDRSAPGEVLAFARDRWKARDGADNPFFPSRPLQDAFGTTAAIVVPPDVNTSPSERIRFRCVLRPEEPLLVKTGYTAEIRSSTGSRRERQDGQYLRYNSLPQEFAVDAAFCLDARQRPYVPGSSLRGALRSRAELTVRTIVGDRLCTENGDRAAWNLLHAQERGQEFSERGGYGEDDVECLISRVFGFSGLGGRVLVSDAVPLNPNGFELGRKLLDHVALDRFTGGAADKRKFNSRPYFPPGPPHEACSVGDLECELELRDFDRWHLGMLLLLLRDLRLGRILLGHGRNKGFGRVRLLRLEIEALSAPGGVLGAVIPEDARSLGGFKAFAAALGFNDDGYVCPVENRALANVFREAEQAMRDQLCAWPPATAGERGVRP